MTHGLSGRTARRQIGPGLRLVLALALVCVLVVGGYLAGQGLLPAPSPKPVHTLSVVGPCDPVGRACTAGRQAVQLTFSLPAQLTPLKRFEMKVRLSAGKGREVAVQGVRVQYQMQGMDMGLNVYTLKRQATDGAWWAQGMLPVCSTRRLAWVAQVTVDTATGQYQARFPFHAQPHH